MTAANTPNFQPEKYTTIASNHLVVYSIHTLYKDGDEISAEDIISACFMLFPKKFSMRTYPQWPDSALVGRRLHDCEKSGWLTARIETGFKLTAKGIRLAEKVAKELGVTIPKKEKPRQVHKLRVTEMAKPMPVAKLAPAKLKPEEKVIMLAAKVAAAEAPKPEEEKAAAPVGKPAVVKPKPAKKAEKKQVEKLQVTEAVKPAPVKAPKPVEKKAVAVVAKPTSAKPKPVKKVQAPAVKTPKPVEKKITAPLVKPVLAKPKPAEKSKKKRVKKLQVAEAVKLAPIKAQPTEKAKAPAVKAPKPVEKKAFVPVVKPAPAKPSKVKKAKVAEAVKPTPIAKPKPTPKPAPKALVVAVQKPLFQIPAVSAEEKAKAGKFVKMMEGSDAYRLYKKNGANANIGEFDFRSLLLCTMESSHETLARNVDLFKGYAEIHNRQDLITFLTVCRDKFAHLLTPEKKTVRKLR